MAGKTENYSFDIPGLEGAANIEVQDENWKKADTLLAGMVSKAEGLPRELTLTLNGVEDKYKGKADLTKEWYAPTVPGTAGQLLKSSGSGAPVWETPQPQKNIFITVASSSAPDNVKASADYVCDGTNDEYEINEALKRNYGTASIKYGKLVMLSPGVFNIGGPINLNGTSSLSSYSGTAQNILCGSGAATVLKRCFAGGDTFAYYSDSFAIITMSSPGTGKSGIYPQCSIRNLQIDCGKDIYGESENINGISFCGNSKTVVIENVLFSNFKIAIAVPYGNIAVRNCEFSTTVETDYAFYAAISKYNLSQKCRVLSLDFSSNKCDGTNIFIQLSDKLSADSSHSNTSSILIQNSVFGEIDVQSVDLVGTYVTGSYIKIEGCVFGKIAYSHYIRGMDKVILCNNKTAGLSLENNRYCLVCSNIVTYYLYFNGMSAAVINGNVLDSSNTISHGIYLGSTTKNCIVSNNSLSGTASITDEGTGNTLKDNVSRGEE